MSHMRTRDWLRLLSLSALVAVLLVVELVSGEIRTFYVDHPLQAGVLTGVLLGTVAYFGFDAVRSDLNERRWAPLSRLAMMAMAAQTTLLIDVALWLVTGRPPVNDAAPSARVQAELVEVRQQLGLPTEEGDLGRVSHEDYAAQLRALLPSPAWRTFAQRQWDISKWRNRSGVAEWAAALLTTGETADVLNRLAVLNEGVSVLQDRLATAQDADVESCCDVWFAWHAEAVSLREDLIRVGRGRLTPTWEQFRRALRTDDQEALRQRGADQREARRNLSMPFRAVA